MVTTGLQTAFWWHYQVSKICIFLSSLFSWKFHNYLETLLVLLLTQPCACSDILAIFCNNLSCFYLWNLNINTQCIVRWHCIWLANHRHITYCLRYLTHIEVGICHSMTHTSETVSKKSTEMFNTLYPNVCKQRRMWRLLTEVSVIYWLCCQFH